MILNRQWLVTGMAALALAGLPSWVEAQGPNVFDGLKKTVSVDLSAASAPLAVEWFNPRTAETILAGTTRGGTIKEFTVPFPGDAVLYIHAQK